MPPAHIPVLLHETLSVVKPVPGETVVDATVGLGGHAEAFLEATAPGGMLIGLDADAQNLQRSAERLKRFGNRVTLHHRNFRRLADVLHEPVDIIVADLGLSSPHVDDPRRGFSFRAEVLLDLRYDQTSGLSAAQFLRKTSIRELERVFQEYGELHRSRQLAQLVADRFADGAQSTADLRACVEQVYGYRAPSVLPQVFQALRIAVNDEIGALNDLLDGFPGLLRPGGRCAVISYHSLEDRLVKQRFRELCDAPRDPLTGAHTREPGLISLTRKAVRPSEAEVRGNPRARSARLRVVQKVS